MKDMRQGKLSTRDLRSIIKPLRRHCRRTRTNWILLRSDNLLTSSGFYLVPTKSYLRIFCSHKIKSWTFIMHQPLKEWSLHKGNWIFIRSNATWAYTNITVDIYSVRVASEFIYVKSGSQECTHSESASTDWFAHIHCGRTICKGNWVVILAAGVLAHNTNIIELPQEFCIVSSIIFVIEATSLQPLFFER